MARQRRLLILAVASIILSTAPARADFLIDDFQGSLVSTPFFVFAPQNLPAVGAGCSALALREEPIIVTSGQPESRCVAGVQTSSNVLGGNRDVFAMILATGTGVQTFTTSVGDEQMVFDLSNNIAGYLRIEWDGVQTAADDTLTLTNDRIDLPLGPGPDPEKNPFFTPASVDNLDEFFGLPRLMPGRGLLAGGVDNDLFGGKLDHSTVDRLNGLGGIDLTEGWGTEGIDIGRFEIGLNRADQGGIFRLTVYSGETAGSFFQGAFPGFNPAEPGSPVAPLIVPVEFNRFAAIPTMTGENNFNPIYSPADFTRVTAIVFELLNDQGLDSTLALLRTSIPPSQAPIVPTLALLLLGLALLSVMKHLGNWSSDTCLA